MITTLAQLMDVIGQATEEAHRIVMEQKSMAAKEQPHIPLYWYQDSLVPFLNAPPEGAVWVAKLTFLQALEGVGVADLRRLVTQVRVALTEHGVCDLPGEVLDIQEQILLFDPGPRVYVKHAWE